MKSREDNISRFLLVCGVLAPIMMMVIIIIAGEITPDYNPVSDTISQMGTPASPYAMVLNGGYIVYAILMGLAAYGLCRSMSFTTTAKIVAILLGIHAIFTILLGFFPDTLDILAKSFTDDLLHNIISAISYIPLLIGILIFRRLARQEKTLKVVGILGLVIVVINLLMPTIAYVEPLKAICGLLQRLLIGGSFLWLTLTFILLYRRHYGLKVRNILQKNQTSLISKYFPLYNNRRGIPK
jgi:hypothetical membrane protein